MSLLFSKTNPYTGFAVASSVDISNTTGTVIEGNNLTLSCHVSGKPEPGITWTRVGSSRVLSNISLLVVVNVRRSGIPDNIIQYQCKASNGVQSPATATANIAVHCKSLLSDFLSTFCWPDCNTEICHM